MLSLSLTAEALEWVIFDVDAKGPLAREGLSVLAVPGVPGGGLVAFGGYDGKYHCDLSCLRPGCVAQTPDTCLRELLRDRCVPATSEARADMPSPLARRPADDCAAVPSPATRAAPAGPKPATQAEPAGALTAPCARCC